MTLASWGEERAKWFLRVKKHWRIEAPAGNGYDILAVKPGHRMMVEVKTSADDSDIPDCFSTELIRGKLVADYLYVVRARVRGKNSFSLRRIDILSKSEVDSYDHRPKGGWKLSSTMKTDLRNRKIGRSVR